MTLRIRLALLLSFVVAVSLLLAWLLARGAVLRPFTDDLVRHHLDAVRFVAEELGSGANPKKLGQSLGLEIRRVGHPPPFVRAVDRGDAPKRCQRRLHEGFDMYFCLGRRAPVAVKLDEGWLVVRRDFDVQAPDRRIGYVLLAVAVFVMGLSLWIAGIVTRPLRASVTAMEHMAAGDLSHRLPESGGRELREVGRAFNQMADRVEHVLRAEKELMAGISHELRTPLARLRLETEILREHDVPEKRLTAMESDLAEIDGLIGELLEMSRLSLGERTIAEDATSLEKVAHAAKERVPLEGHTVVIEGPDVPIAGDHDRLVRVVANLLQNAGKYAPPGTEVRVRVGARTIEVTDRGPGVPPDELGRLFEPFYRGARSRSKTATGLGLGLMIARQIVLMHGGTIEAKNLPEGGFGITIELPEDRIRSPDTRRPTR
jgi:signal transduction histidine kinase